ncbi:unnamed protein product [Linum tenue]|uniref:Uncharacterized protein n=1 Tax=Linum tenue TaxID=586396 RepID=A0AAV0PAR4_9ROSI|nr:unnamed protein product [Linum tenue]
MKPASLLLIILLLPFCTIAQPAEFRLISCSNDAGNYTAGSTYRRNLDALFASLADDSRTTTGFYNLSSGPPGPDRVNAIALCRGDVSLNDCRGCIADATRRILVDCPVQKQAFGHNESCLIRYSNRSIYGSLDPNPKTASGFRFDLAPDPLRFDDAVGRLLIRLRDSAAGGSSVRKFATGTEICGFLTIYGLVQCSPDLSRRLCDDCLTGLTNGISSGRLGGQSWHPNCQVGYEIYRFYAETESPPTPPPPPAPAAIGIPIVVAAVLCSVSFFLCCRFRLKRSTISNQETTDEINGEGFSQFDLRTIRLITNDFAGESKLGEGGFGVVYKGILLNGQEVAVKRLGRNSKQGDMEFKNEVKLVARLQHRNLVRLLGFCLEREERLLVYEFVPNASLDHFLMDADKRMHLNWETRYKIIIGIARGMVYLHEDSRLRIIHRDLKASNILLDAQMSPKISDFGIARLFDLDETRGNTSRIMGTHGYMAPEYTIHGQFSVKSDVFSFGVLVLEMVSGHHNSYVHDGSSMESLLSYAWKNYRNGTYISLVDPYLRNDVVSGAEIARCINIGLLCVQANADDRPTIAAVALMLTSHYMTLPLPSEPGFFTGGGSSSWGYSSRTSRARSVTDGGSFPSAEALPLLSNDVPISDLPR